MNIIKSLEETLKKKRKTLSERQSDHLHATISYLKGLKKDFTSAKKEYEDIMKEVRNR
jgi:hypothetical protein